MVTYGELMSNMTMTISECQGLVDNSKIISFFFLGILAGFLIFLLYCYEKNNKKRKSMVWFIVDNKLQEKYQKWKKDNKNLGG